MVGLGKQWNHWTTFASLLALFLFSCLLLPHCIAPAISVTTDRLSPRPHLLVILSPQYADTPSIRSSLTLYLDAVSQTPGWRSSILPLTSEMNTADIIDFFISSTMRMNPLKACLFIGEDITFDLLGSYQHMAKVSTKQWSKIGSSEVCISLLYPNPARSYEDRCDQICTTLERFARIRSLPMNFGSVIAESSAVNQYSTDEYQTLATKYSATYIINPNNEQLEMIYEQPSSLVCLHGHASISSVIVNEADNEFISSLKAARIKTSILAVDGCYTNGIESGPGTTSRTPFLSSICESSSIHVGLFGLLSQKIESKTNVIASMIPALAMGKTVADAFQSASLNGDLVITGDPTFQFEEGM